MTTIRRQWLRTKRHLRSMGTSPRALRDAERALAATEGARACLCRSPPIAA
jgi:hypothetical protein